MTTNFYDSNVTTVDYQIIFTKRDFEAILEKGTTAVAKAMSGSGFASWKIAEFIRQMDEEGINRPREWTEADAEELAEMVDGKVKRLRPKNFEYLQVEYQVLSTLDRKPARYEEDKVDALQEIARKLPKETHWKTD